MLRTRYFLGLLVAALAFAGAAQAQPDFDPDTVRAGRFDTGRMFTLDNPPLDYFREAYNFTPEPDWFERAQLGALRFATYCSASFVSQDGLILTNHHCARESVTQASIEDGRDYNADGFYARSMDDEKPIEGLFVEQLVAIEDVTDEISAAGEGADAAARAQARQTAIQTMQERKGAERGEGYRVQVVTLYAGGQYKAYTYKRYDNIRLVFAPETQLGFFGGDPDNFTYPRYCLDFALFRAVDENGRPLQVENFFRFEPAGTRPGEPVFVIGNPGSTTRLMTVSQLEYRRDIADPTTLRLLQTRERVYQEYVENHPEDPRVAEYEDTYFSLANSRKVYEGRVRGLRDPYIMARRRAAEREFLAAIEANPNAREEYGDVFTQIGANRASARENEMYVRAFAGMGPGSPLVSTAESRALLIAQMGAEGAREQALELEDQPMDIQRGLLAARLADIQLALGEDHEITRAVLQGRSPEEAAEEIISGTALTTREQAEGAFSGDLTDDPAVQYVQAILPGLQRVQQMNQRIGPELSELSSRLARARFELLGTGIPPDATFTLRISDGAVRGYPYNGTVAPPYTTMAGLYDRYYSHCVWGVQAAGGDMEDCDWRLPQRWLDAMDDLDLNTPMNLVSTNDIIGGNSGSPLLNRELEVVGIVFDGNIESLPGDYIYLDEKNRTVSVDVRAMMESLDEVYDMDRIVEELRTGGM